MTLSYIRLSYVGRWGLFTYFISLNCGYSERIMLMNHLVVARLNEIVVVCPNLYRYLILMSRKNRRSNQWPLHPLAVWDYALCSKTLGIDLCEASSICNCRHFSHCSDQLLDPIESSQNITTYWDLKRGIWDLKKWYFSCMTCIIYIYNHKLNDILVGAFNPIEKYESNWIISSSRGENEKYLKPPTSIIWLLYAAIVP